MTKRFHAEMNCFNETESKHLLARVTAVLDPQPGRLLAAGQVRIASIRQPCVGSTRPRRTAYNERGATPTGRRVRGNARTSGAS